MFGMNYAVPKFGTNKMENAMLTLPAQWRSDCTQHVVEDLMRQARAVGQYADAARAIVGAALDFMLAGPRWSRRSDPVALREHPEGWRISDWWFHVPPCLDDEVFIRAAAVRRLRFDVDLIVPPGTRRLAEAAAKSFLRSRADVSVYPIDTYVELRILWTSLDSKMDHSKALTDLLHRYACLTRAKPDIHISLCAE